MRPQAEGIKPLLATLCVLLTLFLRPEIARANPEGGVVAAGQASIATSAGAVDIHQQSDKAVIDWRSFDIAPNERTEFHQPSSSAIALNRVNSASPSSINGRLKANGNVIIVNQNGVLFGAQANVDVNGLVATTADIDNDRFMQDAKPSFDKSGNPDAAIINQGTITAKESGLVGFVAPRVENQGIITARMGRVQLASGDKTTVDFYGDGLLEVAVSDDVKHQLVKNTGTLAADGGTVAMTAAAGGKVLSSAIEVAGDVRTQSVGIKNGKIIIAGLGRNAVAGNRAANKKTSGTVSTVAVRGALDASGNGAGERGGAITVTGDDVTLHAGSRIVANGKSGGGVIHVGGEYLGGGVTPVARNLTMESGSVIHANATQSGHGGEVILFSDDTTKFDGIIIANAAGAGGNGGFVETSGKSFLQIDLGTVEAKATGGLRGSWLLDPADITIDNTNPTANVSASPNFQPNAGGGSFVRTTTITPLLDAGTNVTIQTNNDAFAGNGDIFVSAPITTTGAGSLTLSAFRNITVGSAITLNGGSLTLRSNNTGGAGGGSIRTTAAIVTNGGNVTMSGGSAAPTSATYNANGSVSVAATGYAQGFNLANFYNGVTVGGSINASGTAAGGNILINGRGESGTNVSNGVEVTSTITTNFAGTIRMSGIGQGAGGNTNQVHGVALRNVVSSTTGVIQINGTSGLGSGASSVGVLLSSSGAGGIARTTTGAITLSGTAGASTGVAYGVLSNFASGINATSTGAITVYGAGGTGTSGQKIGIGISQNSGGSLVANGGAVTLTGLGGTASTTNNNYGIVLTGGGTGGGIVSNTGTGTITLTGTGGGGAASTGNHGVYITGTSATISSSGSGAITVTGTGGTGTGGTNHGVYSNIAAGIRNSGTGSITVNGTAGTTSGFGFITDVANGVRTSGASGNITISSNTFSLNGAGNINSVGTVTIAPRTAITMGVGTGAGTLQFTDTQIGYLTAGTGYVFGNGTGTNLTVNTAFNFAGKSLSYVSNGNIDLNSTLDGVLTSFGTTAGNGTTTVAAAIGGTTAVGPITMTGRDLAANANITSSGAISAAFSRDITVANTGRTITTGAGGGLTLTVAGNSVVGVGNLTLNDAILRVGTGALNLTSGVNGTRPSWTATTTNLVRLGATFGAVTIQGFLDTFINRDINSAGTLTVLGFRDVTLNATNTLTGGGANAVILRAANGNAANTGGLYLNGNVSVGLGGLTLLSGINGTRPSYTATTTNMVRQGATFGPVDIQGFNDFTLNRILNSTSTVSFSNSTRTILNNNVTSTAGAITFSNPVAIAEAGNVTVSATNQNITFGSTIVDMAGGATESLTVNPGIATAAFGGTVDGVALSVTAGTATFASALGATTALGNTSISTTNTLTTPNITAFQLSLATTGVGSMLNIGSSLSTTGSGSTLSANANSVLLKSGAGNISSNNGAITLIAGTYLNLANSFNITSGGGNIALTGPSNITTSGTIGITSSGGNLNIASPLVVAAPLTVTLGAGSLTLGSTVNGSAAFPTTFDVLAVGGGGGGGGTDSANRGGGGGSGGAIDTTVTASVGSTYTISVGGGGGGGTNSLSSAAGGAGGTNGGGAGGAAGASGSSGGGGGGGGLSGIAIGGTYYAVGGGGAGGGGGNEGFAKTSPAQGGGSQTSNTGTVNGGTGQTYPTDGGGGGGGGGGFLGGAGQTNISVSTVAAFSNGGTNYYNPANPSGTATLGPNGATAAGGSTGGAAVSLVAARATYYGYTSAGAGGNASVSGTAGSNGVVVIRYTGNAGQAVIVGGTVTTSGSDTLVTYTNTTGTNIFSPVAGCSGSCDFMVTAGSVTYGGAIGGTTGLDNVSITTTNAMNLPGITAGSILASVTGAANNLTVATNLAATANAGALNLSSTNGQLLINGATVLNSNNGIVTLTGANGLTVSNGLAISSGTAATNLSTTNNNITFTGALTLGGNTTVAAGTGTVAFGSTADAAVATSPNLTVTAGTITYAAAIGGTRAFNALSVTSANAMSLPSITAASILARTTNATANLTIPVASVLTATGTGTPLTLVAGQNFINNAGSGALVLTGGGSPRWLVYSTNPASDTIGSLSNNFRRFSCTYGGSCPTLGTGNGLLYSTSPTITITPSAISNIVYGAATPSLVGYTYDAITSGQYLTAGDFAADTVTGSLNGITSYSPGAASGSVGNYNINYSAGTLSSALGYGFVYANNANAFSVTQRTVTASLIGTVSKVYDATIAATLAAVNYSLSNVYGADVLGISNTAGTYDDKHVGTLKNVSVTGLVLTGATAANYQLASSSVSGNVGTVTAAPLTVSTAGISKTYDGNANALVTLSDDGFAGDALTLSYVSASFPDKNVGNGRVVSVSGINVTGTDSGNYSFNTTASATANITKAPLVVTADNQSVVYGISVPAGTVSYSGFVAGEDATFLATAPTASSVLSGVQNVGTYAGNYTASGGVDGNYSFSYAAGNLTVTKKVLNVTADTITVTYGTSVPAGTLTYSGFIAGEDETFLSSLPIVSSGLSGTQNVGTYVGNYTTSGGTASNYSFNYIAGNLVVTKKDLNISVDNKTVTYGTAVPVGSFTYSGFIAGEDATFLATQPSVSSGLSGIQNAGTYAGNYTASGGGDANYNFVYSPGTLTITPAGLNVTVNNRSVTYGTVVPASTITYTGFITGEDATFLVAQPTISSAQTGIINVGTYTGNYTASGGVSGNYTFNYIAGDLTVNLKPLNVTAGNRTVTYGVAVPASTLAYSGFIAGEDATFLTTQPTISSGQSGIVNAGSYVGNYTVSGGVSNNYSFNYTAGDLTVLQKTLTVTADNKSVVYGAVVPVGTITYSGFIAGEDATFLATAPTVSSTLSGLQNVGTYAGNYTASGGVSNNYTFAYVAGNLDVTKKSLVVTALASTITYGTAVPVATLTYSGFLAGEDATFLATAPTASSGLSGIQNVGTYLNNFTASGGVDSNYSFTYAAGNLVVNPATLTIQANNVSLTYGAGNTLGGTSVTGLQNSETIGGTTLIPSATLSSSGNWNAGSWVITPSAVTGGTFNPANYTVVYQNGTLTVTPRALAVTATGSNKTYDATTATSVTLSDNRIATDILSTTYGSAAFASKDAGIARTVNVSGIAISGTDAGNYTANTTTTTTANIAKANLTITATGINKVFDGTTSASVTLSNNRLAGDVLTMGYTAAAFADAAVGVAKPIMVSGMTLGGADSGNYDFNTTASTVADIVAAGIMVTPVVPPTVSMVTQNVPAPLFMNISDGIYATPNGGYLLVYLPKAAPQMNQHKNRPLGYTAELI